MFYIIVWKYIYRDVNYVVFIDGVIIELFSAINMEKIFFFFR